MEDSPAEAAVDVVAVDAVAEGPTDDVEDLMKSVNNESYTLIKFSIKGDCSMKKLCWDKCCPYSPKKKKKMLMPIDNFGTPSK